MTNVFNFNLFLLVSNSNLGLLMAIKLGQRESRVKVYLASGYVCQTLTFLVSEEPVELHSKVLLAFYVYLCFCR